VITVIALRDLTAGLSQTIDEPRDDARRLWCRSPARSRLSATLQGRSCGRS